MRGLLSMPCRETLVTSKHGWDDKANPETLPPLLKSSLSHMAVSSEVEAKGRPTPIASDHALLC